MSEMRGSGRGKIILFGEHSAVHGYPAAGVPLDCEVVIKRDGLQDSREYPSERSSADPVLSGEISESDAAVFGDLVESLRERKPPLGFPVGTWRIASDVPRAGGFGSSAALCVALARIALGRIGNGYDREVHVLANDLEKRFHGTPSGIDTGLASDDGPSAWRTSTRGVPERTPLGMPALHLLYGALPRSSSTGKTVASLSKRLESGDAAVARAFEALGSIAEEFIKACRKPAADASDTRCASVEFSLGTGLLADRAQKHLASLGLSTPSLEEILRLSRSRGAAGGKLSGAGAGGAFFICAADRSSRDVLAEVLPGLIEERGIALAHPLTPLDFGG